ncbi:aminoacyl-histidine dipeptidase [Butyrivibrio sp. FCS006]|uniref:aminoacyl-histidine dipeptidase n=1 Tax=Butyrivibrio sp. FCS006 TaxID=1280684 RepID=UPI0003FDBE9F|nr:aminoacyl-histidine dipeptidase [Butyrivibrio sp. FCS006]
MALENLQPKEVFTFFEKLCSIPHGSYNVQKISDYLVSFAKERNLEVVQDKELNVIIKAPGSAGYEDKEPVILQGHMDMVAVKDDKADIDMKTDGLRVTTDGEYVWAEGTSLGGDDGIAVAYCLALLDSKIIPHPPLEVVITTNEETGMEGANAIDLSGLKGRKMINIDNEVEGQFITSCAGGARFYSYLPVKRQAFKGIKLKVTIDGLKGGHSGEMIKCGRGNANVILARTLLEASDVSKFAIIDMHGGVADNAIPASAVADIVVAAEDASAFVKSLAGTLNDLKGELEIKDPDVMISVQNKKAEDAAAIDEIKSLPETEEMAITVEDSLKVVSLIAVMPDGVQAMSASVEGLVETSLNLGVLSTEENRVILEQSVRSSVETSKENLLRKLELISGGYGAETVINSRYPGWKYNPSSDLREHMVSVYKKMYGTEPRIEAIHAGLECGILSDKIKGLDCISIGPDMDDIHSPKERLSVKSTANVWEFLKEVLK